MMFDQYLSNAQFIATAPGRVNLLGEHVDYNDGMVLPAAINRAVHLAAKPTLDCRVNLRAIDLNQSVTFNFDNLLARRDINGEPLPSWAFYPAGTAWALQEAGLALTGFDGAFTSDIPIGAGLSSSAAVEVAFAAMWQKLGGWQIDPVKLAQLCQRGENHYVGVNSGLMDQFASVNGVAGHALYFDTRSLFWQPVPLPPGSVIVVADSGVRHTLANSAYNDRRASCEQALSLLRPHLPGIRALRDVSPSDFAAFADLLPEITRMRAQHIVDECYRVAQALPLLKAGDAAGFGQLMLACHASLRDLYQVSCPELDILVELAMQLPGCWGARLTGAGFGGCTVNLVQEDKAGAFIQGLKDGYCDRTNRNTEVYLCQASQGANVAELA
jgi:galactokinase